MKFYRAGFNMNKNSIRFIFLLFLLFTNDFCFSNDFKNSRNFIVQRPENRFFEENEIQVIKTPAKFTEILEPKNLIYFRKGYPDVAFFCSWDSQVSENGDWKIIVCADGRTGEFYWADGKFLPLESLSEKDKYYGMLYRYSFELEDPADFSEEEIERVKNFSSRENRQNGRGTPPFLYDLIYDCKTRISVESHIDSIPFLGERSNAHERLRKPLQKVEKEIYEVLEAAKKDDADEKTKSDAQEIQKFIDELISADSYSWRNISDSGNRSFHSLGLAVDLLPRGWGNKNLYWAWRRDIDPEWMLLPLSQRWMPPKKVIELFEQNGFIWGGKWGIWDNMHFEYRPEVMLYSYDMEKSQKNLKKRKQK